jgi:hypothetical protein
MKTTEKTIIARIKSTDVTKNIVIIALFVIICLLTVPQYVIKENPPNYLVAVVALAAVVAGIWTIIRIIQHTFISGIISVDSKELHLGQRKIAWEKIERIFTTQRMKETYLEVTTGDIPPDKLLVFEEDDDPTEDGDSLAYRINLSNFNLPPEKIERILNEKLEQYKTNRD